MNSCELLSEGKSIGLGLCQGSSDSHLEAVSFLLMYLDEDEVMCLWVYIKLKIVFIFLIAA